MATLLHNFVITLCVFTVTSVTAQDNSVKYRSVTLTDGRQACAFGNTTKSISLKNTRMNKKLKCASECTVAPERCLIYQYKKDIEQCELFDYWPKDSFAHAADCSGFRNPGNIYLNYLIIACYMICCQVVRKAARFLGENTSFALLDRLHPLRSFRTK